GARRQIDEQIEITLRTLLSAHNRSKQTGVPHAELAQYRDDTRTLIRPYLLRAAGLVRCSVRLYGLCHKSPAFLLRQGPRIEPRVDCDHGRWPWTIDIASSLYPRVVAARAYQVMEANARQ